MRSMTGFAAGFHQTDGASVSVEVRMVNHRYLDLHVRLPKEYSALETKIQKSVRGMIHRGRVDVNISISRRQQDSCHIDMDLVRSYVGASRQLRQELGFEDALDLKTLFSLPGILQGRDPNAHTNGGPDTADCEAVVDTVNHVLHDAVQMRNKEGEALARDLGLHLVEVRREVAKIRDLASELVPEYRRKLEGRLNQTLPRDSVDPQRLAQEVALFAERCDISEEIARMESHLAQFADWMSGGAEIGKRMDFLLQEMQRETNTILSKTGNLEITRSGIAIKAEIEKLREQVQNIE